MIPFSLWAPRLHPLDCAHDGIDNLAQLVILFPVIIERHGGPCTAPSSLLSGEQLGAGAIAL